MTPAIANERRDRQILVTSNSEYHMHGDTCVAVRDCTTGQVVKGHRAVGSQVVGRMLFQADGSWQLAVGGVPEPGKCLFFSSHLVTSPLRFITRVRPDPTFS